MEMETQRLLPHKELAAEVNHTRRYVSMILSAVALLAGVTLLRTVVPAPNSTSFFQRDEASTESKKHHHSKKKTSKADTLPNMPNIFMVTLDDVGYNDFLNDDSDIRVATEFMSELATQSVILKNYYGQASCTPARGCLMTGKFVHRFGFSTQSNPGVGINAFSGWGVPSKNTLMPAHMSELGYASHVIGKWNIGHCNSGYMPWNRGAETFLGYFTTGIEYYSHHVYDSNWEILAPGLHLTDFYEYNGTHHVDSNYSNVLSTEAFGTRAVTLVQKHAVQYDDGTPIFVWLAFHGMHDDFQAHLMEACSQRVADLNASLITERYRAAVALCHIDSSISSLIDILTVEGMLNDTVMVIHSDNGGLPCADHITGNNLDLRGSKMNFFEGGIKVPAMVYAPGYIYGETAGSEYHGLMHHVDWLATFLFLAGADEDTLDKNQYDSVNQWDAITGKSSDAPRQSIWFGLGKNYFMLRSGKYKFLYNSERNISTRFEASQQYKESMCFSNKHYTSFLFDIDDDPFETNNLANDEDYRDIINYFIQNANTTYEREKYNSMGTSDDKLDIYDDDNIMQYSMDTYGDATNAFRLSGNTVVDWNCELL